VVQVKISDEGKVEDQTTEDSQEFQGRETEVTKEDPEQEKKEIPIEEMKKAELLEKAKELKASSEKYYDLFVRSQAEIENLKKRFQKEKTDLIKFSNESLIKQLLPVLDNLEKAISASREENPIEALREGVELTLKGLVDTLEKSGLVQIRAEGEPFDPNFHEAILELEHETVPPGNVIQELQKGYTLNERLIRPAMVVVSKNNS